MPRVYTRKTNCGNEPKEIMEATATCIKNGKSLSVLFLKIAHTTYIHNLVKNLFDFALVWLN